MFSNLENILNLISCGNNLGEKITLVGATKTMSADVINSAIDCGLTVVAENKVQEFREKTCLINKIAKQHFIGHLQTNKVKYLVGFVELIHSVDSIHLAQEIDRVAQKKQVVQDILLEVNIGGELSKSGFNPDNVKDAAIKIANELQNVKLKGLMAMLPHSDDKEFLGTLCDKMRSLYDDLKLNGLDFEYLSIGMSNDFEIAIKHGSNTIRLGRTIFGERNYGGNK
jgi:pyridoxal phosphate enzyme (YggS family)